MKQTAITRVRWYSKGQFSDEEMKIDPYLKIVKYAYKDEYSYKDHRYWIINEEDSTLLDDIFNGTFVSHRAGKEGFVNDVNLTQEEFDLVKDGKITLTNNKGGSQCKPYLYSTLIQYFPEEIIYF